MDLNDIQPIINFSTLSNGYLEVWVYHEMLNYSCVCEPNLNTNLVMKDKDHFSNRLHNPESGNSCPSLQDLTKSICYPVFCLPKNNFKDQVYAWGFFIVLTQWKWSLEHVKCVLVYSEGISACFMWKESRGKDKWFLKLKSKASNEWKQKVVRYSHLEWKVTWRWSALNY